MAVVLVGNTDFLLNDHTSMHAFDLYIVMSFLWLSYNFTNTQLKSIRNETKPPKSRFLKMRPTFCTTVTLFCSKVGCL